jgi:exonuclease III
MSPTLWITRQPGRLSKIKNPIGPRTTHRPLTPSPSQFFICFRAEQRRRIDRVKDSHPCDRAFPRVIRETRKETDALRSLHPGERIYSFWDYFRNAWGRNAGIRLDHFLLSRVVTERLVAADVDHEVRGWEKASDHAPAWIELSDSGRTPRRRAAAKGV